MDGDGPLAAERGIADAMVNVLRTAEEMERTQRGHWSLDGLLPRWCRGSARSPAARPSCTSPRACRSLPASRTRSARS